MIWTKASSVVLHKITTQKIFFGVEGGVLQVIPYQEQPRFLKKNSLPTAQL
jgi:hypothetical protein